MLLLLLLLCLYLHLLALALALGALMLLLLLLFLVLCELAPESKGRLFSTTVTSVVFHSQYTVLVASQTHKGTLYRYVSF